MSHITRKPVFGVRDQLRLKPACSADETSLGLEISAIAKRGIILSRQQTTKAPLLFAYGINTFSHDVAHALPFCETACGMLLTAPGKGALSFFSLFLQAMYCWKNLLYKFTQST